MADLTSWFFNDKPAWRNTTNGKPRILAFDVGTVTGFSFIGAYGSFEFGTVEAPDFSEAEVVQRIQHAVILAAPCLVVIEDAFMLRDVSVVKKLSQRIGSIATIATLNDCHHVKVLATQWQTPLLGKMKREDGKKASVAKANALFNLSLKRKDEHISDSLLMALWARGPINSHTFQRIQWPTYSQSCSYS